MFWKHLIPNVLLVLQSLCLHYLTAKVKKIEEKVMMYNSLTDFSKKFGLTFNLPL